MKPALRPTGFLADYPWSIIPPAVQRVAVNGGSYARPADSAIVRIAIEPSLLAFDMAEAQPFLVL
jgi:hypothetical protein